jgi:uncharacterized PurR-regulated membrane protein YhhQ (DUF165 family)
MTARLAAAAAVIAAVVTANRLTSEFGLVPAGFGLLVTAGTYTAGVALVARDFLHEAGGMAWVVGVLTVGTLLSVWLADPRIAGASGVAFAVSEAADTAVYAPLRRNRWRAAVMGSSAVGALVDTVLFLALAFGAAALTWQAVGGQLLVKVVFVAVPVALLGGWLRGMGGDAVPVR